jgi:histidine triad (HIT) family protein
VTSIFSKIVARELPSDIVYEDDHYLVFKDIQPQMNTHLLIIPKKEITNFMTVEPEDRELVKGLFDIARKVIDDLHLSGCQLHMNCGSDHGQLVPHIHLHLMSHDVL